MKDLVILLKDNGRVRMQTSPARVWALPDWIRLLLTGFAISNQHVISK